MAAITQRTKKIRVRNPHQRPRKAQRKGAKRSTSEKNPLFLVGNPKGAKKKTMATKKRKASRPKAKTAKARNPQTGFTRTKKRNGRRHSTPKRRNPSRTASLRSKGTSIAIDGLTALIGLVATRQLPQLALKEKNTGWMGYAANFGTALLAWFGASKFISKRAGNAVAIGGGLYLVNRVLTEKLSPIGQYLSLTGVGDAQAATTLKGIESAGFMHPATVDANFNLVLPDDVNKVARAEAQKAIAAGASSKPATMAGVDRFARSW